MDSLIQQLRPHATVRFVKKGSNILFQGEIPRRVSIVRDGIVRAYTITSTGEERTIALYGKDDVFPLTWILGETTNSLFYYEALSDVRLMTTTKESFLDTIMADPERLVTIFRYVGTLYTSLLFRMTGLEQSRAIEKIGFTLYYLLFRYGVEEKPGIYTINVKLSQLMIASLVGLTRESTAKNLKTLKDKRIISYSKSSYKINKEKLEAFLGEDAFRDLQLSQSTR